MKEHINALDSSPMSNLVYRYQKGVFVMTNEQGLRQDYPLNLSIPSSIMKIIRTFPDIGQLEFINTFQAFVQNSQSLETLSTEKMRRSSRGKTSGIGSKGERLAAFIKQMDSEQKVRFYNNLKPFIPSLNSLETVVKGKPGWIELFLDESWGDNTLKVKSSHISDGFLRIIAFVSLLELDARPGLIVFDEVEDGINPHIASEIVKLLYRYSQAHNRQLVVTTHSSLMLDEFDPSNIIYVYRQVNGAIMAQHIFQRQDVKHMLEYMNPGEIWINTSEQELVGSKQTRS
ncbi:MAG: ATP-binding protein [Candidatus Cloacimonetes bacterium]|nr:ATP-binding protein [Candidatus Cloacimonadota bacterium]